MPAKIGQQFASSMFETVVKRQMSADYNEPEVKLLVAILSEAFSDAVMRITKSKKAEEIAAQRDARSFINDGRADGFAEAIGLHPEALKDIWARAAACVGQAKNQYA